MLSAHTNDRLLTTASSWLSTAHAGTCGRTPNRPGNETDKCLRGTMGSFGGFAARRHQSWGEAALHCLQLCKGCARCKHISLSLKWRDCSWFYSCSTTALDTGAELQKRGEVDFKSGPVQRAVPPLSARLAPCINRHHQPIDFGSCVNLAPAGSGSMYLTRRLQEAAAFYNWSAPVLHQHHRQTDARCLLLPLRDPVARVESGFRYELLNRGRRLTSRSGGRPRLTSRFRNASNLAAALRQADHPLHNRAVLFLQKSLHKTFSESAGSSFLTPQSSYIAEDVDCSTHEVHVLCTETMTEDYASLLHRFNAPEALVAAAAANGHENARRRGSGLAVLRASTLETSDADYLRKDFFSDDYDLHQAFCSGRRSSGSAAASASLGDGLHRDSYSTSDSSAIESKLARLQGAVAKLAGLVGGLAPQNAQLKAAATDILASVGAGHVAWHRHSLVNA